MWAVLTVVSTVVSLYAIVKIFEINKVLSLQPNFTINNRSMVIHALLLVIQSCTAVFGNIPYTWAPNYYKKIWIVISIVDMIV
jgi:hypothetical protein